MAAGTASALVIPDSLLAKEATEILREYSTDLLINHSVRVYLFAAEQGRQQGLRFDAELLSLVQLARELGVRGISVGITHANTVTGLLETCGN